MNDLMTPEDIAALWKTRRDWVMRYLVKRPEFPEKVPGSTRKTPRWRAEDVHRFFRGDAEHA